MSRAPLPLRTDERLIFALDVPGKAQAIEWVERLGDAVSFYKIGMELLASGEYFDVLEALAKRDKRVFVDLKFFDIPATIAGVIGRLSQWPVSYCTIHGWHPAMMEAAAAANTSDMRLLAVTVLTSMGRPDLAQMGIDREPVDVVVERALAAQRAGIDGVIASGQEAAPIRAATGAGFSIVCPGIRPGGPVGDDQQRTVGVARAFADGADAIVVGRPIRLAADPYVAAQLIQAEIAESFK
ncbi:orotidine 5'-phosphate decarboxylase [Stenotrophomonas pictorum JCM 9942]|uniref:Orotidine 5'-phosphate decarboxylase n=2 Tax=Stenotrophomonas pictorum TaxID=86184 RepID=A0A0R0AHY6_9GAMM|nr:orotidine-5'-phosphate decarboxylase [Stenotrophomonas pictorum]KRG44517.1 orotidine 5'-phosphate decarboxylase [Stenotrophomonas pictorum JCM 9942]